jgi:hypothetical protein
MNGWSDDLLFFGSFPALCILRGLHLDRPSSMKSANLTGDSSRKPRSFPVSLYLTAAIDEEQQLVHFHNTRDVFPFRVKSGHCPAGKTEKVDCCEPERAGIGLRNP